MVHRIESTILYVATFTAIFDGTANAGLGSENGRLTVGQRSCVNGEQPMGLDMVSGFLHRLILFLH